MSSSIDDGGAHAVPGGHDPALVEGHVDAADVGVGGHEARDQALDRRTYRRRDGVVDRDLGHGVLPRRGGTPWVRADASLSTLHPRSTRAPPRGPARPGPPRPGGARSRSGWWSTGWTQSDSVGPSPERLAQVDARDARRGAEARDRLVGGGEGIAHRGPRAAARRRRPGGRHARAAGGPSRAWPPGSAPTPARWARP